MKKFFIFIIGLILGFVFFVFLSSWMKALPTDEETTPTVTEATPADEPTVVEEIEVVEAVDCEKFEDEEESFTNKEKNIKWVTAKAVIDSKGDVWVDFEGETIDKIEYIAFEYSLFSMDKKCISIKNGFDCRTDLIRIGLDDKTCFHSKINNDFPNASIEIKDIDKVVGIEIHNILIDFTNDDNGDYDQTGYQKRFYNIEKI